MDSISELIGGDPDSICYGNEYVKDPHLFVLSMVGQECHICRESRYAYYNAVLAKKYRKEQESLSEFRKSLKEMLTYDSETIKPKDTPEQEISSSLGSLTSTEYIRELPRYGSDGKETASSIIKAKDSQEIEDIIIHRMRQRNRV